MVRDIERERDRFSLLIAGVEAYLKQDREAHTRGFRRRHATWRRSLFQESSRENLRRNLRWGLQS